MAKPPLKIYFDVNSRNIYNQARQQTNKRNTLPSIVLTEKKLINIQLVENGDFDNYTQIPAGASGDFVVDNDFLNPQLVRTFQNGSADWTASATPNEYYYSQSVSQEPDVLYENSAEMTQGIVGSLAAGEWGYGDGDTIGESRVYVRLADSTDPDSKAAGWLTYKFPDGAYTKNFIYSDTFNAPGSWWDETTSSFRTPVLANGELTFDITANTEQYADRILTDTTAIQSGIANTSAQVNIFEPGTADLFIQYRFLFLCRNRFVNDGQTQLDLQQINVYTKAEVNALLGGYIPKVSPAVAGNTVIQNADGTLSDAGVPPGGGGGGTDTVKVSADDTTTGYLETKLESSQFEVLNPAGNESMQIKDAGLTIAKTSGLQAALDLKADATDLALKVDKDLTGYALKSTVTGSEHIAIDDAGISKATTIQAIANKAVADANVNPPEFGWFRDANDYGSRVDGVPGSFMRDKDVAPAEVFALIHCDGVAGSASFSDDSANAHIVTNEGLPVVADDDLLWVNNSVADLTDGASGFDIPATGFDPLATEFAFTGRFYVADADKLKTMTMIHIGTGTTTAKVLTMYLDNGFLHYKIGTTGGGGDWTDQDSVEVLIAGYLNVDGWNTPLIQRVADELIIGLNGTIVGRVSMAGKTLNTPDVASKVRFGYGYEGSVASNFFTGYMDELVLLDGAAFDSTVDGVPFETYVSWTDEQYVTKKYDIDESLGGAVGGGDNLTTQYRMTYVDSAGKITESTSIHTNVDGDLAVGTDTPAGRLHIKDVLGCVATLEATDTNAVYLQMITGASALANQIYTNSSGETIFNARGAEAFKFNTSGQVVLGSAPVGSEKLYVGGAIYVNGLSLGLTIQSSASTSTMRFMNTIDANGYIEYNSTNFQFYTANTLGMVINGSQQVIINATTPIGSEKLYVNGNALISNSTYGFDIGKASGVNRNIIAAKGANTTLFTGPASMYFIYDSDNNGANDAFAIARNSQTEAGATVDLYISEGQVLINATTPIGSEKLYVNGAGYFVGNVTIDSGSLLVNTTTLASYLTIDVGISTNDGISIVTNGEAIVTLGNDSDGDGELKLYDAASNLTTLISGGNSSSYINGGGGLLIGTTSDAGTGDKLHVDGNIGIRRTTGVAQIVIASTDNAAKLQFASDLTNVFQLINPDGSNDLQFEGLGGGAVSMILRAAGGVNMPNLPTSDPLIAGELWNNSGVLTVSAG